MTKHFSSFLFRRSEFIGGDPPPVPYPKPKQPEPARCRCPDCKCGQKR